MRKQAVLDYFRGEDPRDEGVTATARALGITKSAVSQWDEDKIPERMAYRLQIITAGRLKVNAKAYQSSGTGRRAV